MILVVLLALVAHVCYAFGDFSGAMAAKKQDALTAALITGFFYTLFYVLLAPLLLTSKVELRPMLVLGGASILFSIGWPLFMVAAKHGNATINGVVAGSFPLWSVIYSLVVYKETLSLTQMLAIFIILCGLALSALHLTNGFKLKSMLSRYTFLALIVSLCWGVGFGAFKYPVERLGWFNAGFYNSVFSVPVSLIIFYPKVRGRLISNIKKTLRLPLFSALSGAFGTIASTVALSRGSASLVVPISGSYGALYAVLSYIKFKERLTKLQLLGVVLTLSGVILLSILVANN